MRKTLAALLLSLMTMLPLSTQAAEGQTDYYPYYLGAGAIGGALLFNFLTGGVDALPFAAGAAGGNFWEGALAANRVWTVASAVAGALIVDWSWKNLNWKS
jgi:uncharacterized membrane protein